MKRRPTKKRAKWLLGLGLDDPQGHLRLTRGPDFRLYGGSKPTHEKLQELTLKSRERLKRTGQTFATASERHIRATLDEVADKLGLQPLREKLTPEKPQQEPSEPA